MAVRKLIIDCDPGHDDIMAILSAMAHPEAFEILGYTTVSGNHLLDHVTDNLCRVLTALNQPGPVCRGYASPLVLAPEPQEGAHGKTGLDGPVLPEPEIKPESQHAVEFMRDMVKQHCHITLAALAPLTNVALFLKTYPELKSGIETITLMGGSRSRGNILPKAEFNIYADPHAAKIVFESGVPIIMSDIEICDECAVHHDVIDVLQGQGPVQNLAHDILQFFSGYNRRRNIPQSPIFDLVPIMQLLHPELFETRECHVLIELEGRYTRGMTVIDELHPEAEKNVTLLEHCRSPKQFCDYFIADLKHLETIRNGSGN